jgi:hypothetical protein
VAHWKHVRSPHVVESLLATVRTGTYKTMELATQIAAPSMALKLVHEAEKRRRRIAA